MTDGIIEIDSDRAMMLGFTSDKFDSYLWKTDDMITISFIVSRLSGKGNFRKLIKTIKDKGYRVAVPTPSARMTYIMMRLGAKHHQIEDKEMGLVEVLEL